MGKRNADQWARLTCMIQESSEEMPLSKVIPGVVDKLKANPSCYSMTFAAMVKVSGGMISKFLADKLDKELRKI